MIQLAFPVAINGVTFSPPQLRFQRVHRQPAARSRRDSQLADRVRSEDTLPPEAWVWNPLDDGIEWV